SISSARSMSGIRTNAHCSGVGSLLVVVFGSESSAPENAWVRGITIRRGRVAASSMSRLTFRRGAAWLTTARIATARAARALRVVERQHHVGQQRSLALAGDDVCCSLRRDPGALGQFAGTAGDVGGAGVGGLGGECNLPPQLELA